MAETSIDFRHGEKSVMLVEHYKMGVTDEQINDLVSAVKTLTGVVFVQYEWPIGIVVVFSELIDENREQTLRDEVTALCNQLATS